MSRQNTGPTSSNNAALFNAEQSGRKRVDLLLELVTTKLPHTFDWAIQDTPEYIFARGEVIDYNKQIIKDVSVWECALWAHDQATLVMLCQNIPKGKRAEALQKLNHFAMTGVSITYTIFTKKVNPDTKEEKITETRMKVQYNDSAFDSLIGALRAYADNYESLSDKQRNDDWQKVVTVARSTLLVFVQGEDGNYSPSVDPMPIPTFRNVLAYSIQPKLTQLASWSESRPTGTEAKDLREELTKFRTQKATNLEGLKAQLQNAAAAEEAEEAEEAQEIHMR